MEIHCIYTYEDSTMKCTKHCLKKKEEQEGEWKCNGGGEMVQGTMYAYMELPQWNPLTLLICNNSKIKLKKKRLSSKGTYN
jgi:hypothetical protein